MTGYYGIHQVKLAVQGSIETAVLSRVSRTSSVFAMNNHFKALLQKNSRIMLGDTVTDEKENFYFVVAKRQGVLSSVIELYKTNSEIEVVRLVKRYIDGNPAGFNEFVIAENLRAIEQTVSGKMHLVDPGLLPTTIKRFLVPCNIGVKLLDTIRQEDNSYQVDAIDNSSSEGFYYLQCSNKRTGK